MPIISHSLMIQDLTKLLCNIDQFHKLAGILEPPPKMLKEVAAWAKSIYCRKVMQKLKIEMLMLKNFTPLYQKNLAFAYALCKQHMNVKLDNPQIFPVQLEDSKYFLPGEIEAWRNQMIEQEEPINVLCRFVFSPSTRNRIHGGAEWRGLWNGMLYLYKDSENMPIFSPHLLQQELDDIGETVRHELQHLMQTYLTEIRNLKEHAGLPGKKLRIPGYNPYGAQIRQQDEAPQLGHELRDIEFYTRISDTIASYKSVINKVPLQVRKQFFSAWIDQMSIDQFDKIMNPVITELFDNTKPSNQFDPLQRFVVELEDAQTFFGKLKIHQPLKYQKAVKEMFKEISKAGLI